MYCKVGFEVCEQHLDARISRIDKGKNDSNKQAKQIVSTFTCFLMRLHKFTTSGIVGGADINDFLARKLEQKGVEDEESL